MRSCAGPAVAEARVGHHRALDSVTVSSARLSVPAASNTASGNKCDPDIATPEGEGGFTHPRNSEERGSPPGIFAQLWGPQILRHPPHQTKRPNRWSYPAPSRPSIRAQGESRCWCPSPSGINHTPSPHEESHLRHGLALPSIGWNCVRDAKLGDPLAAVCITALTTPPFPKNQRAT